MTLNRQNSTEADEKGLEQVLGDLRAAVHAWSDAEYNRPRAIARVGHRHGWRLAASVGLGCLLTAGSLAGGFYEHHQRQEMARLAAQQKLELERQEAARQRAQADDKLLAAVDSDISREVPSALEPLAQLMDDDGN